MDPEDNMLCEMSRKTNSVWSRSYVDSTAVRLTDAESGMVVSRGCREVRGKMLAKWYEA